MAMVIGKYSTSCSFLLSRAMRLYPIYWMTIVMCIIACLLLNTFTIPPLISFSFILNGDHSLVRIATYFLSNISFVGIDAGFFICTGADNFFGITLTHALSCKAGQTLLFGQTIVPPAWTLSMEIYCYLMVPMLARARDREIAILALGSFLVTLFIATQHDANPWFRSFFPAELYLFLIGFLSYRLRSHLISKFSTVYSVIFLLLMFSYRYIPMLDWNDGNGYNIVIYGLFAVALPALFKLGENLPFERKFGELSYPVYISHTVVLSIVQQLNLIHNVPMRVWIIINLVIIVLVSTALFLLAKPLEYRRGRLKTQPMIDTSYISNDRTIATSL